MPAVRRTPALKLFWKMQKWILHLSKGRLLSNIDGFPVLVLHTIGRKTSQPRINVLTYVTQGDAYVILKVSQAGKAAVGTKCWRGLPSGLVPQSERAPNNVD
jgi:hypothetical protein